MSYGGRRPYLICYDIAGRSRLARVHRTLKKRALPVQYSVFFTALSPRGRAGLLDELSEIIDPREDDIRVYPVPDDPDVVWIGSQILPEELLVLDGARNLLRPKRRLGGR